MTPDTLYQQAKCELLPSFCTSFPWVLYLSKQPALVTGAPFSLFHISTTTVSRDYRKRTQTKINGDLFSFVPSTTGRSFSPLNWSSCLSSYWT